MDKGGELIRVLTTLVNRGEKMTVSTRRYEVFGTGSEMIGEEAVVLETEGHLVIIPTSAIEKVEL